MQLLAESQTAEPETGDAVVSDGPVSHEVHMYSKHPEDSKLRNVFVPDLLQVKLGDTVKFIVEDKGHNSVSDKNMLPEGADGWKSKLSKEFEITLTTEGTYGYFCLPHRSLGMVGLILVGDASGNYQTAKDAKQRGKAKTVYKDIFERADVMIAAKSER
ncbi:hypothetical protein JI58_02105 [Marinosulfonomonas sp. PRT-SC04]|nr:hypothetical protein JI58_02105 [Marinosulfonomonas sp. PRT-SC04]